MNNLLVRLWLLMEFKYLRSMQKIKSILFKERAGKGFLWIFIFLGVSIIGFGVYTMVRSLRCAAWPTTEGVVQKTEMKRSHSSEGSDTFSPDITYSYQVAGTNYKSTRLAFGAMSSSTDYAQGVLNRYPVGRKVPVHYSPDDPKLAVLETGIHGGTWVCFGVGGGFVLMGWMFLQMQSPKFATQITCSADGETQVPKLPVLAGVLFIAAGALTLFRQSSHGVPSWIGWAAGAAFVLMGLLILAWRLQNKLYSKILTWAFVLVFLAILHWVSFGQGERIGSSTTPFSHSEGVNVRVYFAAFTIFFDLTLMAGFVYRLVNKQND
jgi:hypothetical protein